MAAAAPAHLECRFAVNHARRAQTSWADTDIRTRLRFVRSLRGALAKYAREFLPLFSPDLQRSNADSLTAEIIPLVEACRFLELEAEHILQPKTLSNSGRPSWLRSVRIEVTREPLGVVLVIGPSNYPLFLPAVHVIQALVAGNAVLWKPARGGELVAEQFAELAESAGLPTDLLTVLDESIEAATDSIRDGADKIILTGSVESGIAVLHEAADHVTPCVMELSGCDAVVVLRGADLSKVARAVSFGLQLNGGNTCISPRRLFAHRGIAAPLRNLDLALIEFDTEDEAVKAVNASPFGLGAAVFGDEREAQRLARRLHAGVVVVNDIIVPTADPRLPFGGRKLSGFGTTRGAEGLLEMTSIKAIATRRKGRLRHLEPLPVNSEALFLSFLSAQHSASWTDRFRGWRNVCKAVWG